MDNSLIIISIDPGSNGGIVYNDCNSNLIVTKMPHTMTDIFDFFKGVKEGLGDDANLVCYLEDVGQGMPNQSSRATATFARHNGHLEMALYALGIRTIKMTPQKWQKALSLSNSKKLGKTEWKNALKDEAKRLFPNEKITLWNADALLIYECARRLEK